ncbi:hypothetical protein B0A69_18700 [Chryseobacterium shigense]|uniref:hypothetical protein n=1 Tax=Chryseobacterium shigense TaxID=297244 RepID=UPI000970DC64|nr:hypothetical protein [Chryseobacterium shigense]PQA91108.1 hypothetical protein B0A69_18700 [Chryseobacterium shigense]
MKILEAFSECSEENDIWEIIRKTDDCYYGKFDSAKEFTQYLSLVLEGSTGNLLIRYKISNGIISGKIKVFVELHPIIKKIFT